MKSSGITSLLPIIALIILGFVVYSNSLTGSFIWDDNNLIRDNSVIKSGSNLTGVFFKDNISTYTGKIFRIYRPLQILTHMVDYRLWGLNPIGYHLTNTLLHISVALLLYWLIILITSDKFISLITAGFFVTHPVHTEAVSYISGRSDPLAAVFAVLCFIFYVRYLRKQSALMFVLVISAYILSLFSRENTIILPLMMLAYNYSFRRKVGLRIMMPIVLVGLLYAVLRLAVLKNFLPDFNVVNKVAVIDRLPGFFAAITDYVRLLVWPYDLHMEYGDKIFSFADVRTIGGMLIAGSILFCAFRLKKINSVVTFGLLWFLIALVPVSNLYPIGAYMAEHWLYLPSVGLFLVAAGCLKLFYTSRYLKIAMTIVVTLIVGWYSYLTINQNFYWQDPVDFYEKTLEYAPESMRANNDLAVTYERAGMHSEAMDVYDRMLKKDPGHPDIYVNLAAIQIIKGNADDAIDLCKKAIALAPENATAHNNISVAYYVKGEYDLAIKHYDLAVKYGYKVKDELTALLAPHRQSAQ